jgi:hypothetical protein
MIFVKVNCKKKKGKLQDVRLHEQAARDKQKKQQKINEARFTGTVAVTAASVKGKTKSSGSSSIKAKDVVAAGPSSVPPAPNSWQNDDFLNEVDDLADGMKLPVKKTVFQDDDFDKLAERYLGERIFVRSEFSDSVGFFDRKRGSVFRMDSNDITGSKLKDGSGKVYKNKNGGAGGGGSGSGGGGGNAKIVLGNNYINL